MSALIKGDIEEAAAEENGHGIFSDAGSHEIGIAVTKAESHRTFARVGIAHRVRSTSLNVH